MDKFKKIITVPITKIDDEEQMVFGWASTPDIDSDGEVIKSEALEKALPNYMKFPTIREMHQAKAVGTTKQAEVTKKGLYIGAKIVSKEAWELVKEGVYKAFSVGGNVIKRVGNVIQEMELIEVSLVDVPANKAAVIEVFKNGKLTKDAESAYSLANLVICVKDMISYFEYEGKDSTKLAAVLESLKSILATEAREPEKEKDMEEGPFAYSSLPELEKKIKILESMEFVNNPIAEMLRKGVIISMKTKAQEVKKDATVEDPKKDEKTEVVAEETKPEPEVVVTPEPEEPETPEEEETETAEEKEAAAVDETLKKLMDVQTQIEKIGEKATPVVAKVDTNVQKAVSTLVATVAKFADVLTGMDARLKKVESTPAQAKSRSVAFLKGQTEEAAKKEKTQKEGIHEELEKAEKRLKELNDKYDEIGRAKFGKEGYSDEASKLQDKIRDLKIQIG